MKNTLFSILSLFFIFSLSQTNQFPVAGDGWFNGNQTGTNNYGVFNFMNGAILDFNGITNQGNPGAIKLRHAPNIDSKNTTLMTLSQGYIDFMEDNNSTFGNWHHGLNFSSKYVTLNKGGLGLIGNDNSFERMFFTFGDKPQISIKGINILPNGFTGIGTLNPTATLEITSLPEDSSKELAPGYGNSGLRLTNLTSSSNPTPNAAPIGVDATGKVVRVEGSSSSDRAWLTIGNNGTTASNATYGNNVNNNFLGTIDNQPLVIATNNKERVRISTSGRLTFHNNDISPNAVNNLYIGGGNEVVIGANNYGNTAIGLGSLPAVTSGGNRNTAVGSNALRKGTSGDNNIGIGYNAGANLTSGSNNIIIGSNLNAPISASTSNQLNIGGWIFGRGGQIAIGNFTNLSQAFTNNEEYQLIVKRGIRTEKVRVDLSLVNNWADYVFEEDYKLMPIEELEKFIIGNKHLPNIPKAEQLIKSGIDIAEMDAKLLEKIEELTLYNINLYKENKELKEENEKQQILLDELLKRVEQLESTN